MKNDVIRVGIVGLGENTRLRHVPGLRTCANVEIVAVCNRRPESTAAAAREFAIPKTYAHWQQLVADSDIDAVLIGTWPYLHCPVTLAALESGKHVLTEARLAMDAAEARNMLEASNRHPELVCQVVPSPFGFHGHLVLKKLVESGFLGELREVVALGTGDQLADAAIPLRWRQIRELSGVNMLTLGILHEALIRYVPDPVRVFAFARAFIPDRIDSSGMRRAVGTPDSVHVLAQLSGGAQAIYHASGVTRFGPGTQLHFYGSEGTLKYEMLPDVRLWGGQRGEEKLREIPIPADQAYAWRVEAEFIGAIRGEEKVTFTDFATGVRYMEFTEAVAQSAATGEPVDL